MNEARNKLHKEELARWYGDSKYDASIVHQSDVTTLWLVRSDMEDAAPCIELVRVFSLGESTDLSVDFSTTMEADLTSMACLVQKAIMVSR